MQKLLYKLSSYYKTILDLIFSPIWSNLKFFTISLILINLPFLTYIFFILFGYDDSGANVNLWIYTLILHSGLIYIYIYILCGIALLIKWRSIQLIYYIIICSTLFILSITEIFLNKTFQMGIDPLIVSILLQTNNNESSEFFSTYIINNPNLFYCGTAIIIALVIMISLMHKLFAYLYANFYKKYNLVLNSFILIICSIAIYNSYNYINSVTDFIFADNINEKSLTIKRYPKDIISKSIYSLVNISNSSNDTEILIQSINKIAINECHYNSPYIILILGESFNKHHSDLYGYQLSTNPKLKKRRILNELFIFSDVITPYNSTSSAIQAILSTAIRPNDWRKAPLFPCILKKSNYHVSLIDNQMINTRTDLDKFNYLYSYYLNNPTIEKAAFDYRNDTLYQYDIDIISEYNKVRNNQSKNNFIFFHLMGQHVSYKNRFPHTPEFEYFTIDSINRTDLTNNQKQQIVDYDNATRYNDFVVDSIIKKFENDDAILIYISDHGDEVNDYRPHIGRSHERPLTKNQVKYQFEIPMMIWCSQTYIQNHPEIVNNIKSSVDKPYSIEDISHLIMDLAGINSPHFDKSRSIINPNFKIRKRALISEEAFYEDIIDTE